MSTDSKAGSLSLPTGAGKANQPPLKLRRSAGALAKAEGRREARKGAGVGPRDQQEKTSKNR
jgi:hypothetical protein